jgi:quercetin dioxygenase-like cupin family protein
MSGGQSSGAHNRNLTRYRKGLNMKAKTKVVVGVAAIIGAAGFALATPIVGLISPILAAGNQNADIHKRGTGPVSTGERFKAELETEGPSTISIQDGAYAFPGQNGWHSHPGLVAVTIISGSIQWYDENCVPTIYKAGDSWVEGSQVHAFRNIGPGPVHLMAWFITAQGQPLRTNEAAPACAAGLGL